MVEHLCRHKRRPHEGLSKMQITVRTVLSMCWVFESHAANGHHHKDQHTAWSMLPVHVLVLVRLVTTKQ